MVPLGWLLALTSLGAALTVILRRRPGAGDTLTLLTGAIGVAVWNVACAYYLTGPLPYQVSALYLVGVSLAVTGWLLLARRIAHPGWWPRPWAWAALVAPPVLLALTMLLPADRWGRLFWPQQPWRHEPLGIGYQIHSPYAVLIIAIGAAALLRWAEHASGLDRTLAIAAVAGVAVGVGGQLTGVRIMPYSALVALLLVLVVFDRGSGGSLRALAASAESDPVTGALARVGLDRVLAAATARASRIGTPLSVLVVDVDDFKGVNDAHGHVIGDQALRHVADRMLTTCSGLVGRYGGDEFVVVLPGLTEQAAAEQAGLIADAIAAPLILAGHTGRVRASIGVAQYAGGAVSDLLVAADRAMYAAKRRGGGRVATASAQPAA